MALIQIVENKKKSLGIYVHIPFCRSKCEYCDGYSSPGARSRELMDRYLDAVILHIREAAQGAAGYEVDTVYFGGGTPSCFGAGGLAKIFAEIDRRFKGDVAAFVDQLFATSIFGSDQQFARFLQKPTAKALREDPMIRLAQSVQAEKKALDKALAGFDTGYALAHRTYVKGLLEMYGDRANFPDANSTLRLAYGQVKGYSPKDCDYYGYQTTLEGVMEKEDPNNWEFVVPDRLKELYRTKDFGPYQTAAGKMPVAFCATTHTTGGNSGSPVMNADGALIGINFDRNWEGVGGDIQYLPDYQRSIIVDIRYVLFVIDKYANAGYLLKEMDLVK